MGYCEIYGNQRINLYNKGRLLYIHLLVLARTPPHQINLHFFIFHGQC